MPSGDSDAVDVIGVDFRPGLRIVNSVDMTLSRPPQSRPSYHHGDLASAIVVAALRRIRERGSASFSLREAARDVGVDPSAVYRHFADKDALLAAVAREGFARMAREIERALETVADPAARLRVAGLAYVTFASKNPDEFRLMFGRQGAGNEARTSVKGAGELGKDPYAMLKDILYELEAARLLTVPVKSATLAAWCGVHGLASLVVEGAWRPSAGLTLAAAVEALVLAFIATKPRGRPMRRG